MATVPAVLFAELVDARRAGGTFTHAWPAALRAALAAAEPGDQLEWEEALRGTAGNWEDAFEHRPASGPEMALAIVATDPDRIVPIGLGRECAECGGEIPATRGRQGPAKYCSADCKRAAQRRRERRAA